MGWFNRCCGGGSTPSCSFCTTTPATVSVTFAGFQVGTFWATYQYICQCCTVLNATHILSEGLACIWVTTGSFCSTTGDLVLTPAYYEIKTQAMVLASGNWGWRVTTTIQQNNADDVTIIHEWDSGGTVAFDCTAQRTATYVSDNGGNACSNLASVTCTIN